MKADYKNWVPNGMIAGFFSAFGACVLLLIVMICAAVIYTPVPWTGVLKTVLALVLLTATLVFLALGLRSLYLYRAFSYKGERRLSGQIIDAVSKYVEIPDGGVGLDVGCGSGALTIACAKRNPKASMVGLDRWGREYASFSRMLCENNARAEGVSNVSFRKGDAVCLEFPAGFFDAVTSNYVYHNIPSKSRQTLLLETLRVLKKGGVFAIHDIMTARRYGDIDAFASQLRRMGYEDVRLVDITGDMFRSAKEASFMGLAGSMLLVGRK